MKAFGVGDGGELQAPAFSDDCAGRASPFELERATQKQG